MATIESFESGSLDAHWTGDTGAVSVTSGATWSGKDGTYYVETTDTNENALTTTDTTISPGDTPIEMTFEYQSEVGIIWGVDATGGNTSYSGYFAGINSVGSIFLQRCDTGTENSLTTYSGDNTDISAGDIVTIRVTTWDSSGNIEVEVVNHSTGDTVNGPATTTDTTYGAGGYGFEVQSNNSNIQRADNYRAAVASPIAVPVGVDTLTSQEPAATTSAPGTLSASAEAASAVEPQPGIVAGPTAALPAETVATALPGITTRVAPVVAPPAETLTAQEPGITASLPTRVIDDFESGSLDAGWQEDTADYTVQQDSSLEGSYLLEGTADSSWIWHEDGETTRGNAYRFQFNSGTNDDRVWFAVGAAQSGELDEGYYARFSTSADSISLYRWDNHASTLLGSADVTLDTGTTYIGEIEYPQTGDDFIVRVYDANDTELAAANCGVDDTYSGGTVSIGNYFGSGATFDYFVETEIRMPQSFVLPAETATTTEPGVVLDAPPIAPMTPEAATVSEPQASTSAPGSVVPSAEVATAAEPDPVLSSPGTAPLPDEALTTQEPSTTYSQPGTLPLGAGALTAAEPTVNTDALITLPLGPGTASVVEPTPNVSAPPLVAVGPDTLTTAEPGVTTVVAQGVTVAASVEGVSLQELAPIAISQPGTAALGPDALTASEPQPTVRAPPVVGLTPESTTTTEPSPVLSAPGTITIQRSPKLLREPGIRTGALTHAAMPAEALTTSEPSPTIIWPLYASVPSESATATEPSPTTSAPGTAPMPVDAVTATQPTVATDAPGTTLAPAEGLTATQPPLTASQPGAVLLTADTLATGEPLLSVLHGGVISPGSDTLNVTEPGLTASQPPVVAATPGVLSTAEPEPAPSQPGSVVPAADVLNVTEPTATSLQPGTVAPAPGVLDAVEPSVLANVNQPIAIPVSAESIDADEPGVVLVVPQLVESLREADAELVLERRAGHVHDTVLVLRREGDSVMVQEREADSTLRLE